MLKILTLNINGYYDKKGPWPQRRGMIRDLMTQHMPDIVALQAVRRQPDRADGQDQAQQLADLLPGGLSTVYAPAGILEQGASEGPALISQLYIADSDTYPLTLLPGLEDGSKRLVLYARFDLASTPLHVFNGHFSWVGAQAERNVQQAVDYFNRFSSPRILVGDLNNPPESPVFEPLRAAGWVDAWAQCCPEQPGYTYEAGNWSTRIDFAWLDPDTSAHLVDVKVVGDRPANQDAVYLSDHCGLLVTLDFER